ncbi:MAG: hypothetical protein R3Y68_08055 [Rikenellaceae bacterium]
MKIFRHITAMVVALLSLSCSDSDALDDDSTQQREPVDYSTFFASIDTSVTSQNISRAISYSSSDTPDLTICFDDASTASYTYDSYMTYYMVDEGETMGESAQYVYSDKSSTGAMVAAVWPTLFQYDTTTTIQLKNMNPMVRISYKYKNTESINAVNGVSLMNVYSQSELSIKGTQLVNSVVEGDTATKSVAASETTALDSDEILSESELAEEEEASEAGEEPIYTIGTYELYTVPQTLSGYQGYVEFDVDGDKLPYYFSHEVTLQSGYLYDLVVEIKSVDNTLTLDVDIYEYEEWTDGGSLAVDVDINNPVLDVWDGSSISTELEGNGIEGSPYLIKSAADLKYVATCIAADVSSATTTGYLQAHYELQKSIDWDYNSFASLGSNSYPFKGVFDGGGYTIKNVMIYNTTDYSGLFAVVGEKTETQYIGQVRDLTINNVNVTAATGYQEIGALVGLVSTSALIENCHVINCSVTGGGSVGGVAGSLLGAIRGCVAENTTVTAIDTTITSGTNRAFAGGVVGLTWNSGVLELSYSLALNCVVNGLDLYTAGIAGSPWNAYAAGFFSNCYAANIESDNENLYGAFGYYAGSGAEYALSKSVYHNVAAAVDTTYRLDDASHTNEQRSNLLNGNDMDSEIELGDTPTWYWAVDEQRNSPYPYYHSAN